MQHPFSSSSASGSGLSMADTTQSNRGSRHQGTTPHATPSASTRVDPIRYVAVSVQQVYIGPTGRIPMVASRVSICDYRGQVLIDTYVRPTQPVTDYRSDETGLQPASFQDAPPFQQVQQEVADLVKDKILVGYCLWHFLLVMGISHPAINTRDVALFLPFRKTLRTKTMIALPTLVNRLMARNVGFVFEDPMEHARASLDLYRSTESLWEAMVESGAWPCALPPSAYANWFT